MEKIMKNVIIEDWDHEDIEKYINGDWFTEVTPWSFSEGWNLLAYNKPYMRYADIVAHSHSINEIPVIRVNDEGTVRTFLSYLHYEHESGVPAVWVGCVGHVEGDTLYGHNIYVDCNDVFWADTLRIDDISDLSVSYCGTHSCIWAYRRSKLYPIPSVLQKEYEAIQLLYASSKKSLQAACAHE